nr:photosystem I reaction center subunit N, chloroplastic [Ipomoea batatas]
MLCVYSRVSPLLLSISQVLKHWKRFLSEFLKKSEENKEKNDKERLESYYKRNYKDYFGLIEGTLRQKVQNKEQLTESEQRILEWLDKNK